MYGHLVTMRKAKLKQFARSDIPLLAAWLFENRQQNHFDPDVMEYASTRILSTTDKDGPVMYLPYQLVFMLESIATRPGVSKGKVALSLQECFDMLVTNSEQFGIGEIYTVATEPTILEFAKAHGFEEMEGTLLRIKVHKSAGVSQDDSCSAAQ